MGDINVASFLRERLGENPGEIVDANGVVVGQHRGLWFYTIGQRHGFTINQTSLVRSQSGEMITKHNIPPFYVIAKDAEKNQLVVGFGEQAMRDTFQLTDVHLIDPSCDPSKVNNLAVRIRHGGALLPCQVKQTTNTLQVNLEQPIPGISEGQFGTMYYQTADSTVCIGAGVIVLA